MGLVPHLVQLHEKHKDKGLRIVALTNDSRGELDPFIKEKGIAYAIGLGGGGAYGVRGIPQGYLIGADGKVVWEGHPSSLGEAVIEAELAKVRRFPDLPYSDMFKGTLASCQKKDWAKALKELEKIAAEDNKKATDTDREHAAAVRAYIEEKAGALDTQAKEAAAANDWYAAAAAYGELEKFEGLPLAEEAGKTLKEMKKDKDKKDALTAGALLEQGRAMERAKDLKGALQAYMKAAKAGKDTIYGAPAKESAERLIAKGVK